ncbi:hypothetical protein YB2330_001510 [Saitoella coloradoensis]
MPKPIHGPVIPTRGVRKVQEPDDEGFDSYCTICDHLIPLASLSQLYCSERCRKTDTASHPLSSTNPNSLSSSPTGFTPHEWPEPPPSIIVPPALPTLLSDHRPSFSSPALSGRVPLTPASAPMSRQNSANGTLITSTSAATTGGLPTLGSLAARPPMLMHTKTAPAAPQLNSIPSYSYSYSSSPALSSSSMGPAGCLHPSLRPLPPLHAMSSSPRSLDLVVPLSSPRNSGSGTTIATSGVGSAGTGFGGRVGTGTRSRSNSTLNPNPALNPPATTPVGTNGPDTDLYFGKMYRTPSSSSSHSAGGGAGLKKLFYFKEVQRVPSELTLANAGRSAPVGEGEGVLSLEEELEVDAMFGEEGERMEWPR